MLVLRWRINPWIWSVYSLCMVNPLTDDNCMDKIVNGTHLFFFVYSFYILFGMIEKATFKMLKQIIDSSTNSPILWISEASENWAKLCSSGKTACECAQGLGLSKRYWPMFLGMLLTFRLNRTFARHPNNAAYNRKTKRTNISNELCILRHRLNFSF